MNLITKKSKAIIYISTIIWSIIMLIISAMMYLEIQISDHFSHFILLEFAKSIISCYIISIGCASIIDIVNKKVNNI